MAYLPLLMCHPCCHPLTHSFAQPTLCSGVVWYNHSKLRALKAKAARQDGKCDEDLEQPQQQSLQSRTKADILGEIQRLQHEMDGLERRGGAGGGAASKLKSLQGLTSSFSSLSSSTVRVVAGGDSSGSSSPGSGVVRGEEHERAMAALSGRHNRL